MKNDTYQHNGSYSLCQRTGYKVRTKDIVREWTGLLVHKDHVDKRHPSDCRKAKKDKQIVFRKMVPEGPDQFRAVNAVTKDSF